MSDTADYTPPKVWTWNKANGGRFANINRPIAGPMQDKELPVGRHPFQLYSLGTPNGQKVTIMFEELLALGISEAEYDAWFVSIMDSEQFGSGFVAINPNSKIPALLDLSGPEEIRIFESAAMLLHLGEKFGYFLPADAKDRAEDVMTLDEVGGQREVVVNDADGPAEVFAPVIRLRAADGGVVGAENLLQPPATLARVIDVPVEEGDDVLFILGEEDDFLAARCERLAVELHGAAIRELGAEEGLMQLGRQRRRRGRRRRRLRRRGRHKWQLRLNCS